jgi:hypothetical protein
MLLIEAADGSNNISDTSVTVYRNMMPLVQKALNPPYPIVTGSKYSDTLITHDGDGDLVNYEKAIGPTSLTVSKNGTVNWSPTASDTGTHNLIIRYLDGLESALYQCSLTVVDSNQYGNSVSFSITEQDFPVFVETGDTVRQTLSVSGGTGPYKFEASLRIGSEYQHIAVNGNTFQWIVPAADTGYQHFLIRVEDQLRRSDTLYPSILAVPPNRDFNIVLEHGLDTLPDGTIDMRQIADTETLTVRIMDPDTAIVEEYSVTVTRGGFSNMRIMGGADSFLLVLDPSDAPPGRDTIIIRIEDRGGFTHADTLTVIYRGLKVIMNTAADGANITETQYDFPVLIRLNASVFNFSEAAEGGTDIHFEKADGTTLPHEIERWNESGQVAEIWVKMDTILANNRTQFIEMCWDDENTPGLQNAVFDTGKGFAGAWHMNNNPSGGIHSVLDATINNNDGTCKGAMASANLVEGLIANGLTFDGVDDYVEIDYPARSLKFTGNLCISAWIKPLSDQTGNRTVLCRQYGSDAEESWAMGLNNKKPTIRMKGLQTWLEGQTEFAAGSWYHIAAVRSTDTLNLFVNGALAGQVTGHTGNTFTDDNEVTIGANKNGSGTANFFNGIIDEPRAMKSARSAAWIKLCYESQKLPCTFITFE